MPGARQQAMARLVAVVRKDMLSKLSRDIEATSEAVMQHMALRLTYADPGFHLNVFTDADLQVLLPFCVLLPFLPLCRGHVHLAGAQAPGSQRRCCMIG
jgi:hypothetical protein